MSTSDAAAASLTDEPGDEIFGSAVFGEARGRELTRIRLMHAAYEVFAETGLDGTSVEAICERAGYTRGAFYSNFTTKDDLFLQIASAVADRRLEVVAARVEQLRRSPDAAATPVAIVNHVLDGTLENSLAVVLMNEVRLRAMRDDATAAAYREFDAQLCSRVAAIIESLSEAYGLRLHLPAADIARLVLGVWENAMVAGVIDRLPVAELRERAAERAQQIALALVDFPMG